MKRITLLAFMLAAGFTGTAQLSYEAADDYGRLEGINYDLEVENKVYGTSLLNHIVVSYDNGDTWDLQYAFPDTGARITNLRVLPGNENLCFSVLNLSPEENGIYILNIQANLIVNFIALPNQDENPSITNFDVFDAEASTILLNASTDNGTKVFYTTTTGENWNEVYASAENNDVAVNTVAISPDDANKLFLGRGLGPLDVDGGMFISEDAGETWTETLPGSAFASIAFNPEDSDDIIIGTDIGFGSFDEALFRSADGGATWTEIPMEWNDFVLDNVIVVKFHPTVPSIIFVLEENEIISTDDGGETWVSTAYAEEEYYYGLSISINPFDTKEAIITTNDYPKRTSDGGETIEQVKAPFCRVDNVRAIQFGDTEHLYYSAQGGHLHKNYGTGMTEAYNIQAPNVFNLADNQIVADPTTEGRIFIYVGGGFMGGNLYVSTDHGATRTQVMNDFASDLLDVAVDADNTNIIYAALDSFGTTNLYKLDISDLENVTSEMLTLPGDGGYVAGILTFMSGEDNNLIITLNGTVFKSTDAGASWTELYTVEGEATINDIALNPLDVNTFSIATGTGVYTTEDGGTTWAATLEGVSARKVEHSQVEDGIMAVGVYNGMDVEDAYITYYNGTDWVTVTSEEMNYLQSYAMDFNFEEDNIIAYVGTVDIGVIRYSFPIGELGIDNPATPSATAMVLAPNPVSDVVTVSLIGTSSVITNISIYSVTGQKVMETANASVNVSALTSGIYIVSAVTSDNVVITSKLIRK